MSALFLWQRARRVTERRKRIAPTWLLVAKVLFVTLAALALARPVIGGAARPDLILVVDASASMTARDSDGVRLDKARAQAERLLRGAGRVALIRAGLDARVVVPLTSDRALVRRGLQQLRAGDRSGDLDRAIAVAQAIEPGARVEVFTDQPHAGGGTVRGHDVAGDGVNVGISAFDLGLQQAYVGVVSNSRRPIEVRVDLTRDGAPVASGTVLVPADGTGSITFPLADVRGIYRAAITPQADGADALTLDDVAYAGARPISAAVEVPDDAVMKALAAVPGVTVRTNPRAADIAADLRVLTRADAAGLAPGSYLLFAPASSDPVYRVIAESDRGSPLLRFVDLNDVVVGLDPRRPAWSAGEGWHLLASTAELEPVLRYRDRGGVQVLQAAFSPRQTDLVLRAAFPALIANYVREVRGDARVALGSALPGGTTLDGAAVDVALTPGIYLEPGGTTVLASLDSDAESRLAGPAAPASGPPGPAAAERRNGVLGNAPLRPLAWLLLALAVLALTVEWWLWSGAPRPRLPRLRARSGAGAGRPPRAP